MNLKMKGFQNESCGPFQKKKKMVAFAESHALVPKYCRYIVLNLKDRYIRSHWPSDLGGNTFDDK